MWINVTSRDISNSKECPITLALRRTFKNNITATRNFIKVKPKKIRGGSIKLFELDSIAQNFLLDYDYDKDINPFRFWISSKDAKKIRALK